MTTILICALLLANAVAAPYAINALYKRRDAKQLQRVLASMQRSERAWSTRA